MNKKFLSVTSISLLILLMSSFASTAVAALPDDAIEEVTFAITYIDTSQPYTDQYNVYSYSGIHWAAGKVVTYSVNTRSAPAGALNAIKVAFETWDAQVSANLFNDAVQTTSFLIGNMYDGRNVVSWGRLGKGIIAQTSVWYNKNTMEIVEFGMVFSTAYKWGIDSDGEGGKTLKGAFDVQNIATHEAGHTLMLDDLYMPEANQLTMYGYGSYGQTYARSLGVGDISGIKAIYP